MPKHGKVRGRDLASISPCSLPQNGPRSRRIHRAQSPRCDPPFLSGHTGGRDRRAARRWQPVGGRHGRARHRRPRRQGRAVPAVGRQSDLPDLRRGEEERLAGGAAGGQGDGGQGVGGAAARDRHVGARGRALSEASGAGGQRGAANSRRCGGAAQLTTPCLRARATHRRSFGAKHGRCSSCACCCRRARRRARSACGWRARPTASWTRAGWWTAPHPVENAPPGLSVCSR